jgi:hypothetical protein
MRGAGVTSTAGIQTLSKLQESTDIARERVRTGEITSGTAQNLLQQQTLADLQTRQLQGFQQGRFGAAQLSFQQQELDTQLRIAQLMGRYGQQAGQQQLLGTVAGAGIGALGSYLGRP